MQTVASDVPRWSWALVGVTIGVVAARWGTTWRLVTGISGETLATTIVGTTVPAVAGVAFARSTARTSTRELARAQREGVDEYEADLARHQRELDAQRRDVWGKLRDDLDRIPGTHPRTTMRYDRARVSLDRHATDVVSTFIAGAAR